MKPFVGTANLLAGQAVAHAEALLDGRTEVALISDRVGLLYEDLRRLRGMQTDLPTSSILDAAFMLTMAVRNAAKAATAAPGDGSADARGDRWRDAVASLADHVRKESIALTEEGHFA